MRSTLLGLSLLAGLAGMSACGDNSATNGGIEVSVPLPERELFSSDEVYARISALAQAVESEPSSIAAWTEYGEYLYAAELDRSANEVFQLALEYVSGAEAWRLRYLGALAQSRYDPLASIASLRELIGEDPGYVPAQVKLGVELSRTVDPNEALGVLQRAHELAPDSPDTQAALGMVLTDLARFEEAIVLLEQCLAREPDRRETHAPLARCYFAMGREAEAQRHGAAAGRTQGVMTREIPRHDPRGVVDVDLSGTGPRLKRADEMFANGEVDAALLAYEQVAIEEPTYYIAWLGWAKALLSQQRVEEARSVLERGIEHSPSASVLHDQLGGVHLARDDWAAAEVSLNRALELRPGSSELLVHRAQLFNLTGAFDRAQTDLDQALRSDSNSSIAWIEKALCALLSGAAPESLQPDFEQLSRCTAIDHRAFIRLGTALQKHPRGLLELEPLARKLANKFDEPLPLASWLGGQLLTAGQGKAAHEWLARVLQRRPDATAMRLQVSRAASLYATQVLATDVVAARKLLLQSQSLNPSWKFPVRTLAWSLATDTRALEPERSLQMAQDLWMLPKASDDPMLADTLAAALAANGRFEEALEIQTGAIAKLPPNLAPLLTAPFQNRLALYRQGLPFRSDPAHPLPEGKRTGR